jgi:hypothetical protein
MREKYCDVVTKKGDDCHIGEMGQDIFSSLNGLISRSKRFCLKIRGVGACV